jgi:diguanylate cyclase (GGDEF)-like protein
MQNSLQILGWVLDKIQPFFGYHVGGYLILEGGELVGEIKHRHECPLSEECVEDLKGRIVDSWMSLVPIQEKKRYKINFSVVDTEFISPAGKQYRKIESFAAVPLLEKAKIVALLVVGSFRRNAFTESDKRLLSIIASHVSVAIARVRLFAKTKELAEKDELTQLYNYRYFDKFLREEFEKALREGNSISLMILDLDHFKEINDRYGHSEGNEVIKSFALIIKQNVKDMGIVARFGGDEFGIVLPGVEESGATQLARQLNIDMRNHNFIIQNSPHKLSTSIGIATFPTVAVKDAKELFARGDEALYKAKQQGRDCFFVYGR